MDSYGDILQKIPQLDEILTAADSANEDPEKTNSRVLRGYTKLSSAFGRLLHGDMKPPENATFLTFAAWATESIRPDVVDVVRGGPPEAFRKSDLLRPAGLFRLAANALLGDDDSVARNLVRGEAAIYEEIGMTTCLMLQHVLEAPAKTPRRRSVDWPDLWDRYSRQLKEMHSTLNAQRDASEVAEPGDISVLQSGVEPYFQVFAEGLSRPDLDHARGKRRAELILMANIRMLAYEQKRIQPVLRRNLAYIPDVIRARVGSRLTGRNTLTSGALRRAYNRSKPAAEILDEAFQIAATRNVYSMILGTEKIRFGRDLPVPPPANPVLRDRQPYLDQDRYGEGSFFPFDLQSLKYRPAWAEWQLHDRSTGDGGRTAVDNWLRYGERLSFLVNLFRSRQQLTSLYEEPRSTPPATLPRPADLGHALEYLSHVTRKRLADSFEGSNL